MSNEWAAKYGKFIGGYGNSLNRKVFDLKSRPESALLRIVTDAHTYAKQSWMQPPGGNPDAGNWLLGGSFFKYRIFVNGVLTGAGPFRAIKTGSIVEHEFDITELLNAGENVLGIFSRGEKYGFACALELTFADQENCCIYSDCSWKTFNVNDIYSPVCWFRQSISQDFKGGAGPGEWPEHIDGLRFPDNWNCAGFDDSLWNCCTEYPFPENCCVEKAGMKNYQPQRVLPQRIERRNDGRIFVDFGREVFAGLEITGPAAGGNVEIRLSENLQSDNTVQFIMQTFNCYQEVWSFKPGHQKLAHFGTRMFRYAELVDYNDELTADKITAVTLNTPFAENESAFSCSEKSLEKIYNLCKNSIKYTNIDSYVDCLSRERIAYEADSYINMLTALCMERNFDLASRTIRYQMEHPTWPCEWKLFMIPIVYEYVMHSGDLQLPGELYNRLIDDFTSHKLRDKLALVADFKQRIIVDWPERQRDGYEFGDYCTVPNAFVYYDSVLLSKLADLLGKDADCRQWKVLASEHAAAFNRELFDPVKHLYKDCRSSEHCSLHSSMFAAAFDLVPEHEKAFIGEFLSKKGMACSVYGAQFLLEALFKLRCGDAAVELMLSSGPRSWLAMLEQGATVTYEAWSAADKPNMSSAHPWGSAAGNQIARGIFGLQPLKPGWEEYSFDPQPGKIKSARIILPTVRGFIHAEFTCSGGEIRKSAELKNTPDPDFVR